MLNSLEQKRDRLPPMSNPSAATQDLKQAIGHAMKLLSRGQPELAKEQAEEILRHYPGECNSEFIVAAALRAAGDNQACLDRLRALVKLAPDFALAQQELGFSLAEQGQLLEAIAALQKAVAVAPSLAGSWKLMGELFLVDGDAA